jgi:hypothetical protein
VTLFQDFYNFSTDFNAAPLAVYVSYQQQSYTKFKVCNHCFTIDDEEIKMPQKMLRLEKMLLANK